MSARLHASSSSAAARLTSARVPSPLAVCAKAASGEDSKASSETSNADAGAVTPAAASRTACEIVTRGRGIAVVVERQEEAGDVHRRLLRRARGRPAGGSARRGALPSAMPPSANAHRVAGAVGEAAAVRGERARRHGVVAADAVDGAVDELALRRRRRTPTAAAPSCAEEAGPVGVTMPPNSQQ